MQQWKVMMQNISQMYWDNAFDYTDLPLLHSIIQVYSIILYIKFWQLWKNKETNDVVCLTLPLLDKVTKEKDHLHNKVNQLLTSQFMMMKTIMMTVIKLTGLWCIKIFKCALEKNLHSWNQKVNLNTTKPNPNKTLIELQQKNSYQAKRVSAVKAWVLIVKQWDTVNWCGMH